MVLDTTVLIDLLRGRAGSVAALRSVSAARDVPWTTPINVEEIVRGLRPIEEPMARRLLAGLRLAPLDESAAWQAGEWRRDFAGRGITLSQADCLIAAATAALGARLAAGNPRRYPMAGLTVEHWPTGT